MNNKIQKGQNPEAASEMLGAEAGSRARSLHPAPRPPSPTPAQLTSPPHPHPI